MSEKPCETCAAQGLYAYSTLWTLEDCQRNCPLYFRWEGHQEGYAVGLSERDALRAEVERYKRALEKAIGLGHYCPPGYTDCDDAGSDIKDCAQCRSEWALSEAGK